MKRIEQLQPLSKEHHLSLVLDHKAIKVSSADNQEDIATLCQQIVEEYPSVWKIHFQIEEESIFSLFNEDGKSITKRTQLNDNVAQLCKQLKKEHTIINDYYMLMKSGDYSILESFGHLLKQHTRTEERQLFPALEALLSPNELTIIYQTSLKYR